MKFTYQNRELVGFDEPYNQTIHNERAVELAIAADWIQDYADTSFAGLEVGNVLGHYGAHFPMARHIVDKYEQAAGVQNIDVFDVEFHYHWIVAISTLEHVGYDEEPRDLTLAAKAIGHLADHLLSGGQMLITVPGGYHPALDDFLASGGGATRDCTLVRNGDEWQQTEQRTFRPYGVTTPWAESVWIGEYERR